MSRSCCRSLRLILACVSVTVSAQTYTNHEVRFTNLYTFTGGLDGGFIAEGLARDLRGNLYGVAYDGGQFGGGDIFKLAPTNDGYAFRVLMSFFQVITGGDCMTTPVIDESGNLYGVCSSGGSYDSGTLWKYASNGTFTVLHSFNPATDGCGPKDSVVLDGSGNIYGTAYACGPGGGEAGTFWVYSQRLQEFQVLHAFVDGNDGGYLPAGPAMDPQGTIWGTTESGPNCYACGSGTAWKYQPSSQTFTTVLDFSSTSIQSPRTRLAVDKNGNLFGTGFGLAPNNCGLVFELQAEMNYEATVAYEFAGGLEGCNPAGRVKPDRYGALLGTTAYGGPNQAGLVYGLAKIDGRWQEIVLHAFDGIDGEEPQSGLITDHHGNWFGTTTTGGSYLSGTVFEISGVP